MDSGKVTAAAKALEKAEKKLAKVQAKADETVKNAVAKAEEKAKAKQAKKVETAEQAVKDAQKAVKEAFSEK